MTSLQSAIREIQRFQSSLPMRDITSAMKAIDTTTMRQIRAMDQIARAAINAFDTPEMRYLRAMERIVIAPLPSGEIAKSMAQALETYRRYDRMIPSFVDDAVRSAQKFHQLIGHVQAGVENAVHHGRQIHSIVNQASEFLSSVDWPTVRERLEELRRENEAEFETEIQTTVDEVYRETVEDGDDLVTILQRLHSRNDEPKMGRRDAIVDSVKSVAQNVVGTVIGGLILKELIDATKQASDKPPSNVRQRPQRKAHRAKPNRGEPNRGTPNRAEPNRGKPNDGKPADGPVKAMKPKQDKA